jgi:DNA-binding response OmpR family regulator
MSNKILIVDDDFYVLEALKRAFASEADIEVIVSTDPESAADLAAEVLPSLILLDLYMPKMNGLDVGYKLKSNPTTADIPIMFMSGHPTLENAKLAFFLGAVDLIQKPFNPRELIKKARASAQLCELKRLLNSFLDRSVEACHL